MLLTTVFKILLHRYTGQQDICIGTPIANRTQEEVESLIGFFVNTLALRTHIDGQSSFHQLLQQVKATTLEAYTYQDAPFEKIVERLEPVRDLSRTPIFQVMFSLANNRQIPEWTLDNLQLSVYDIGFDHAKYDLSFTANETSDGLEIGVSYCSDLFAAERIEQMQRHFFHLLQVIVQQPHQSVGALPMLSRAEEKQVRDDFNATQQDSPFPDHFTAMDCFAQQVIQYPDKLALVEDQKTLSYAQLDVQANQLANYLLQKGLSSASVVAICMPRSIELIISILAVLKTGNAYLPIDPSYPSERIHYLLQDSQSQFLLVQDTSGVLTSTREKTTCIALNEIAHSLEKMSTTTPPTHRHPEQLAYVIYTSGSTGKPKGVAVKHRSLLNLIHWHCAQYEVTSQSRSTLIAGVGFDASVWELWPFLTSGGTLYIVGD
ncbi:MAG: AMP-binding protein, partial [Bacteroidota bacterium]